MKFDTYRHTGDVAGRRFSAFLDDAEFFALADPKQLVRDLINGIVAKMGETYFEEHKAELLAAIDIPAILEQVQSDIAVRLVTQIVAAMPPVQPTTPETDKHGNEIQSDGHGAWCASRTAGLYPSKCTCGAQQPEGR